MTMARFDFSGMEFAFDPREVTGIASVQTPDGNVILEFQRDSGHSIYMPCTLDQYFNAVFEHEERQRIMNRNNG